MFARKPGLLLRCSLLAPIVLVSCAPVTRTHKSTEPYWTVENPLATRGASDGSSQLVARQTQGDLVSSSLDALKRGESTATPASSPLKDIYFEFDRYELGPDAREILIANADWLKKHPSLRVEIEGHCDERGSNEYNLALGAKRAEAAKDYLVTLEISVDRLSTISYGEEIPACMERAEACWLKNRRDRFVIVSGGPTS
jgi:peptidoglycan-associated lipoprotein